MFKNIPNPDDPASSFASLTNLYDATPPESMC
jgi:hypothetical protein